MARTLTLLLAGALVAGAAAGCSDDESPAGEGGATATTSSGTGATGTGASTSVGGQGGAGGNTSTGGSGGTALPTCDASVQNGTVCTDGSPTCKTTTGCCECRQIVGCGWDPRWVCVMPPGDPLCPTVMPAHAEPCTDEGILCEYCRGAGVELWRCHNSLWTAQMPTCT